MKRCMYCGHENEDANDNCVKCGNPLLDMPTDNNGMPLEEQMPVEEETVADVQQNDSPEQEPVTVADDGFGYPGEDQYDYNQGYAQYGGQDYGYPGTEDASSQYGGQAYGYGDNPQEYGQDAYYEKEKAASSATLMKKARKRMHNPFLFLGLVFYSIHFVAEILNYVLGNALENVTTVNHFITTRLADQKEIVQLLNTGVSYIQRVNKMYFLGGALITLFPVLLFILGLWIAFGSTSYKKEHVSTGGYTLARVAIVLKLIMICAAFLSAIVFLVIFVVSAGASSHMMSLIGGVIVLLVLVLVAVLVILYYVQVMFGLKVIRTNVRDGMDIGKIPGFAIFVGFLGCAVTVLSMIPMAPDDYIGLASKAAYAAWLLFGSLWAIIYRATVRTKKS